MMLNENQKFGNRIAIGKKMENNLSGKILDKNEIRKIEKQGERFRQLIKSKEGLIHEDEKKFS